MSTIRFQRLSKYSFEAWRWLALLEINFFGNTNNCYTFLITGRLTILYWQSVRTGWGKKPHKNSMKQCRNGIPQKVMNCISRFCAKNCTGSRKIIQVEIYNQLVYPGSPCIFHLNGINERESSQFGQGFKDIAIGWSLMRPFRRWSIGAPLLKPLQLVMGFPSCAREKKNCQIHHTFHRAQAWMVIEKGTTAGWGGSNAGTLVP